MSEPLSRIETPTDSYVCTYPWAVSMTQQQQDIFWPAEELGVEEDLLDVTQKLSDGERAGLMTVQSILTQYELIIGGDELWGGRIAKLFPRPEIQRLCACFANVELGSHAPFYDLNNKVLGVATDEFYQSWKSDPILAERIAFIEECCSSTDALEVTAALAFLEGAVLFSAFAYFKAFNSRGWNLIPHFVSGIDGSAKDENLHSIASSKLFRTCKEEREQAGNHNQVNEDFLQQQILSIAERVYSHESRIIDMVFELDQQARDEGADSSDPRMIRMATKLELKEFVRDRINVVMSYLDYPALYDQPKGIVSGWFYEQLSTYKHSDFFNTTQLQYTRSWALHKLKFRGDLQSEY